MHWIDPDCLPETAGTVERFIVNPHGEVDGLLMMTEKNTLVIVHTPPNLEADIVAAVKVGDAISVRGVRPRGADMIAAVALAAENGPGPDHDRKQEQHRARDPDRMEAQGEVRLSLFGPKGELRGALLQDGTIVRIGPKEAEHFAELLSPGATIAVRGDGLTTKHGRVVHAKEAGPDLHKLRSAQKHKDKPQHKKERAAAEGHA
jgi:hypothetical protein